MRFLLILCLLFQLIAPVVGSASPTNLGNVPPKLERLLKSELGFTRLMDMLHPLRYPKGEYDPNFDAITRMLFHSELKFQRNLIRPIIINSHGTYEADRFDDALQHLDTWQKVEDRIYDLHKDNVNSINFFRQPTYLHEFHEVALDQLFAEGKISQTEFEAYVNRKKEIMVAHHRGN